MHGKVYEWWQDYRYDNYEGAPTDDGAWLAGGDSEYRILPMRRRLDPLS